LCAVGVASRWSFECLGPAHHARHSVPEPAVMSALICFTGNIVLIVWHRIETSRPDCLPTMLKQGCFPLCWNRCDIHRGSIIDVICISYFTAQMASVITALCCGGSCRCCVGLQVDHVLCQPLQMLCMRRQCCLARLPVHLRVVRVVVQHHLACWGRQVGSDVGVH
jgi:hypothetical protein